MITNIRNIKDKFDWFNSNEKPILDILLDTDNKLIKKSLLKLKKRKKVVITTTK